MESSKKLVVITGISDHYNQITIGASSGIGAEIAKYFSSKGFPLLLLARRLEKMQSLKLPNCLCLKCDVTNLTEIEQCIAEGEKKYGPVDLLVNNAGVMLIHSDPSVQNIDEWNRMIDLNCKGLLNGIKVVLAGMKARQGGTIVNISSTAGIKNVAGFSVYCGTKHFVHAVTESMREEMAKDNVRIVTITPGVIESELREHVTDAVMKGGLVQMLKMFDPLPALRVAESVYFVYSMPQSCCIRELVIAPTKQSV